MQSAHGTCFNALSAVDAGAVRQGFAESRAYRGTEPALGHADRADLLYVLTGGDAAAAVNTLAVIAYDGRRNVIYGAAFKGFGTLKGNVCYAVFI